MKNVLTLIVVIACAIAIGVALSVQFSSSGILGQQMAEVIKAQERSDQHFAMFLEKQSKIEERLAKMEGQQTKMLEIFDGAKKATERLAAIQAQGAQQQARPPAPPSEDMSKVYDLPVAQSPVRGKKNAAITITKFVDFQCPFCQRFYAPVQEVLKAYPNDVNFVIKNFPLSFHPMAKPAAKAALAAGEQGKYWEMVDGLLEGGQPPSEERFKELAKKIGLNVDKFLKDYKEKDAQYEEIITRDLNLGGQSDVRGTPTFFINGKKTAARDFAGFKAEIDKILQEKKAK